MLKQADFLAFRQHFRREAFLVNDEIIDIGDDGVEFGESVDFVERHVVIGEHFAEFRRKIERRRIGLDELILPAITEAFFEANAEQDVADIVPNCNR